MRVKMTKLLIAALLLLLAVVSYLYVADWASAPETHQETVAALEDKAETVLKLSAAAALVSSAVTLLPGDVGTPIADKLADFTTWFLLVLSVLLAEKYLVSILGAAAFRILIPLGLVLAGASLFCFPRRLLEVGLQYTGHTMQSPKGARGQGGSLGRRKMRSPVPRLPPNQTLHSDKVWVLPSPSLCILHWLYRQCPWPSLAVELLTL